MLFFHTNNFMLLFLLLLNIIVMLYLQISYLMQLMARDMLQCLVEVITPL